MPQMGPLPWAGVSIVVFLVSLSTVSYLYFLMGFGLGCSSSDKCKPWRGWKW